jgi:hypothetical protein
MIMFGGAKARMRTAIVVLACAMSITVAPAQNAPNALETQLESIYKVTQLEGNTQTVIAPGTLLKLTKSNLLYETPIDNMFRCNANVKGDKMTIPGGGCIGWTKTVGSFLQAGQLLYITKIKVNPQKDIVTFELVEAAAGDNGNAAWPKFKTGVNFNFDPGYLAKADPGQLAEVINSVLPLDGADDNSQGGAQPAPAQAMQQPQQQYRQSAPAPVAQPAAAAPAGPQVQLGMTEDQVKGILGQPTAAKNYAGTTVYMYHKTIMFQNGKVSSIQ